MPRLFVFAIGGTGSRVLKSLTMLLASGVKPKSDKQYEIVPIIIDPHKSNDDLIRTIELLKNYQNIKKEIQTDSGFFSVSISTLDKLISSKNSASESFTYNLQQVSNTKFSDYIDYNQLPPESKALTDILFSGSSINKRGETVDLLDIEMDIGFVGNPNIGSVVLNQFKDSKEFIEFANNFNLDDRIFIISSIFGGTGAAGFPTVLKNIRDAINNQTIAKKGYLQDAKIGALSVLPYFNIETKENSPIKISEFITKTKAALYYYKDNVTGNDSVNAMYYIGDSYVGKSYVNDPGDNGQKNDAHFIELVSALSIIDFLEIPDYNLESISGKATKAIYREFAIKNDVNNVTFADLDDDTERKISLHLSQLFLFRKYLREHLDDALEAEAWTNDEPLINNHFVRDQFYHSHLSEFLEGFNIWLTEMSNNQRGFSPFNLDSTFDSMIIGRKVEKKFFSSKFDKSLFNDTLSKISKDQTYHSASHKLLQLFYDATNELLTSKYGFKK